MILTKKSVLIEPAHSLTGDDVAELLDRVSQFRGYPDAVRTDQGPEFTCKAFDQWAYEHGVYALADFRRASRHRTPTLKALTASYAMNASTNIGSVIYIKHKKSFQLGEEITMNNDRIHRSTI